jgi:hypothetical protein
MPKCGEDNGETEPLPIAFTRTRQRNAKRCRANQEENI